MDPLPQRLALSDQSERLLNQLRATDRYRTRRIAHPVDATHVEVAGIRYVNFASNNYLGLSHHPLVCRATEQAVHAGTVGSGGSALITGYTDAHASAEAALAQWKGTESAVLLNSGFAANYAGVQALTAVGNIAIEKRTIKAKEDNPSSTTGAAGVRFLIDKLCHASLVDAVRDSRAPFRVFPHNHLGKLDRLLREAEPGQMQVVVTESIFSMDGDAADLHGLIALKMQYPFVLLLDEAHASGVYGSGGKGLAEEMGVAQQVDVTVVTLSKALGCMGGAVCASRAFCEAVVNSARSYVYSTNLPPALAAAGEAAIGVLRAEPQRQVRVRELAKRVRAELASAGLEIPPGDSPIIPIILGDEKTSLAAAEQLRGRKLWTTAVRPPTVPRGASRLRVTLSCEHTDEEVRALVEAVRSIRR